MLQLRTLGRTDLRDGDGKRIDGVVTHQRRLALLAYIATPYPARTFRRDEIATCVWPELDKERGREALAAELHVLRRALGDDVLKVDESDTISVDPRGLCCDAAAFESLLAAGQPEPALALYGGEFLVALHAPGEEFERWLSGHRIHLSHRAVTAARELADQAEERGDTQQAVSWSERAVEFAPYDDASWQRLVGLLERSGDHAGAEVARQCMAALLGMQLEVEPSAETLQMIERIRERTEVPAGR